ncbi:MAG: uroporphyrinogen-III synthase [Gemmatimonadota bacterium]
MHFVHLRRQGPACARTESDRRPGLTASSDPTNDPLTGLRVAVTRPWPETSEDRLSNLLRLRGARPLVHPLTRTLPPLNAEPLRWAVARILEDYDWIVVTSARSVAPLLDALRAAEISVERLASSSVRICAVGPATGAALSDAGLAPDLLPMRFESRGVVSALRSATELQGTRVLMPRAADGQELIPRRLRDLGARVTLVSAYRTMPDREEAARLTELVSGDQVDALAFTSGSAVRSFAAGWGERGPLPMHLGIIAIGPTTAAEAADLGIRIDRVAVPHTLEGLIEALEAWALDRE